jgi:DNA-binding FadR family transcriptional regulator
MTRMKPRSAAIVQLLNINVEMPSRPAPAFPLLKRPRFADQAYTILFHKVVTGEFKEGEMLPSENDLCAAFGMSRPVVREALHRLRIDGLIESRRGSGSFVQNRPPAKGSKLHTEGKLEELLKNLEFRSVIEPTAAFLAAQRRTAADLGNMRAAIDEFEQVAIVQGNVGHHLDFRFHQAVAMATGNKRFVDAIQLVEYDIDHGVNLVRYLAHFDHLERTRSVHAEHSRILAAIRQREPEAARKAMHDHLQLARVRMMKVRPGLASRRARGRRTRAKPNQTDRGRRDAV